MAAAIQLECISGISSDSCVVPEMPIAPLEALRNPRRPNACLTSWRYPPAAKVASRRFRLGETEAVVDKMASRPAPRVSNHAPACVAGQRITRCLLPHAIGARSLGPDCAGSVLLPSTCCHTAKTASTFRPAQWNNEDHLQLPLHRYKHWRSCQSGSTSTSETQ